MTAVCEFDSPQGSVATAQFNWQVWTSQFAALTTTVFRSQGRVVFCHSNSA